ncbi:hypothetical protein HOLleu_43268 [Holothuria leucospilota]|uniref:RNA-directed DNA polymerase n=1 Tax=Holothuria leucospilota TaxID=206669 RepID=A0A9Q0Y9V3_HOLLE|nr:hypothetical protein HOLleu_43268 [Holothuria leucospilota]
MEAVATQARQMENAMPNPGNPTAEVKRVNEGQGENRQSNKQNDNTRNRHRFRANQNIKTCFRCGNEGHIARDPNCPAKEATCNKCKLKGHFAKMCKTKPERYQREGSTTQPNSNKVNNVEDNEADYIFILGDQAESGHVNVTVGGVTISMLIDSGATCNIIGKDTWEFLKAKKVKCQSEKTNKSVYPYGSRQPLSILGKFKTISEVNGVETNSEFLVLDGKAESLLGKNTAIALGVLRLGPRVNSLKMKEDITTKFPGCFSGIGKLQGYKAKLNIDPEVTPVAQKVRRIPFSLRVKLERKLLELEERDIIEKVLGPTPWVSPVVIVPKPSGDIRLCVDMRLANQAIIRERYPIPTIEEILQNMNDSAIYSKLDLNMGFHQIELAEESRSITTFVTHTGLYRYKRLMFGISSAPELYQHIIQQVVAGCEGTHNISDDIIVHGKDLTEHNERLEKVLKRIQEAGLTLNEQKCEFNMSELVFMGHKLSGNGICPSDEKVEAIRDARQPTTASEIRSFLGLVQFCSRFIPDLATKSEPLRRLTKKGEDFNWGVEQEQSFQSLKDALMNADTLAYFDKNTKTQVISDASPVGLGAILVQEQKGELRIIAYASRSLTDIERRYSQTEKEALGLVWACERFHIYLYGTEFELLTDHKPLEFIYSQRSLPSARIERWVLRLQSYNFKVKYIPGTQNIADALSRLTTGKVGTRVNIGEEHIWLVAQNAAPVAIPIKKIEYESGIDPELTLVRDCVQEGKWSDIPCAYKMVRSELAVVGKLVLRGNRIVIPKVLRSQVVELAHEGHQGIVKSKQRLRTKVWWPGVDREIEKKCKTCHGCQVVGSGPNPDPIQTTPFPTMPWQHLAADLMGPLPDGSYLFVVVDYFSRYFEVDILRVTTSEKLIKSLEVMFSRYGYPETIKTDNGPNFVSAEFESYLKTCDIGHRKTTPYWPQANGEVERQNRTLLKALKIAQVEGKDWKSELNTFLLAYRSTPHSTTGMSPSELLFNRKIRTKLPELSEVRENISVSDRDAEMKQKYKDYCDNKRSTKENQISVGEKVLVQQDKENKLSPMFNPEPFKVVEKHNTQVTVQSPQGVRYKRNASHLKRYNQSGGSDTSSSEGERGGQEEQTNNKTQETVEFNQNRPTRVKHPPRYLEDYVT